MVSARLATSLLIAAASAACSSQPLSVPDEQGAPGAPGTATAGPDTAPPQDYALTEYPLGPYGRSVGSVIENLEFVGWHDPVAAGYDPANFEIVRLSDYHDPNGEEVKLIVLNASAVWCTVCRAEYRDFKDKGIHATYRPRGVQLIGALFEDIDAGPARPEDLSEWGAAPGFSVEFPLVLDPGFKLGRYFTSDATPLNLIIDARDMRILDATMGYDLGDGYWQLIDALLASR